MKKRIRPYLITYAVWFVLLVALILNSTTENGDPYPVGTGLFLSILCAAIFSLPFWVMQRLYFYIRTKKVANVKMDSADTEEPDIREMCKQEKECAEPIPQQEKMSDSYTLAGEREDGSKSAAIKESRTIALQGACRKRIPSVPETQKREESERARANSELRRKQKKIAQEVITKNQRVQQEQRAQQELYRRQRTEKLRGLSDAELLKDAIRFASTQFYITAEEMELEYPTLSQKGRLQLLSALEKLGAVQARPGSDSWLSLVDRESSGQLIEKLSGASNTEAKEKRSIDQMDGHEFEHFCADLLRDNGFTHVEVTQASGDFGIDVLAQKDGVTYGIQCKCYSDTVGNHAVQEAFSGAQYYHRMVAVVMTNNYFTPAAIETAQRTNVLLWDRDKVLEMANG